MQELSKNLWSPESTWRLAFESLDNRTLPSQDGTSETLIQFVCVCDDGSQIWLTRNSVARLRENAQVIESLPLNFRPSESYNSSLNPRLLNARPSIDAMGHDAYYVAGVGTCLPEEGSLQEEVSFLWTFSVVYGRLKMVASAQVECLLHQVHISLNGRWFVGVQNRPINAPQEHSSRLITSKLCVSRDGQLRVRTRGYLNATRVRVRGVDSTGRVLFDHGLSKSVVCLTLKAGSVRFEELNIPKSCFFLDDFFDERPDGALHVLGIVAGDFETNYALFSIDGCAVSPPLRCWPLEAVVHHSKFADLDAFLLAANIPRLRPFVLRASEPGRVRVVKFDPNRQTLHFFNGLTWDPSRSRWELKLHRAPDRLRLLASLQVAKSCVSSQILAEHLPEELIELVGDFRSQLE